jgi:hypothetical protein
MKGLFWMLFWQFVFVLFVLPWAWIFIVLGFWDDDEQKPKIVRWIVNQAIGNF